MSNVITQGIVRGRGQLTIPDEIRKVATWLYPETVVSIVLTTANVIHIKPQVLQTKPNWDMIWNGIHLARSFKGKGKTKNLSQQIAEDRAR